MKSYSQNEEQEVITNYFLNKIGTGRFLDIGAFDGITLSNTYALVLNGWTGVAVEASPSNFCKLQENYKNFPNVKLVCACIEERTRSLIQFYQGEDGLLSTAMKANAIFREKETKFTDIYITSNSITSLLFKFGKNFNFINIDIEGQSFELFKRAMTMFSFEMICVEHDDYADEIKIIGNSCGFKEVFRNHINIILAR
jgi:FkbM family methyltransferase